MSVAVLPRNTTRQAETTRYGEIARVLHRISGAVIVVFVLAHVVVQAILHAPALASAKAAAPWLPALTTQHWIHAILYFSIVFHTLHGLRLLANELGARLDYRLSLWVICGLSAAVGLRELARYAGL
jgi:succinate dehydrogenase/fumarate reductase cytochrome b subunit